MALYTPKEIAAHLRVCPETVKRLTASGKIPGVKVGALLAPGRISYTSST